VLHDTDLGLDGVGAIDDENGGVAEGLRRGQ
jgi:hypothetical protein